MPLTKIKSEKHAVAALVKPDNSKISKKMKGPVASAAQPDDT